MGAQGLGQPLDLDLAEKIVGRVAGRAIFRFGAFPDLSREDLMQEGLMAVRKAWPRYDPAKAHRTTFMYIVAWRAIETIHRQRSRRLKLEHIYLQSRPEGYETQLEAVLTVDWLRDQYKALCDRVLADLKPPAATGRPRRLTPAQTIAIGLLHERTGWGSRRLRQMLGEEGYRDAIGLSERAPARHTIRGALGVVQKLAAKS